MKCADCLSWKRSNSQYEWEREYGQCVGLNDHDNVEIELKTGWDGGVVSRIETKESFYCANFKEEEKE